MPIIYKLFNTVLTVHEDPFISLMILGIFDVIAYKIAYSKATNSNEHWSIRLLVLSIISIIYVTVVNVVRWIAAHWIWILIALISILLLLGLTIFLLNKKRVLAATRDNES